MLLPTVFLLVVFSVLADAKKHHQKHPKIHHGTSILDLFEYDDGNGHFKMLQPLDAPVYPADIRNLFLDKIRDLIKFNSATAIDKILQYSASPLKILSCTKPGKDMNWAELSQLTRTLYYLLREFKMSSSSFTPDSGGWTTFKVGLSGVSQEWKAIQLDWEGVAKFDGTKNHYLFTQLSLVSDCSQIPQQFPNHPTEPIHTFIAGLNSYLENNIFADIYGRERGYYKNFIEKYVLHNARVYFFCQQAGFQQNRDSLSEYFWQRYGQITDYLEYQSHLEQPNTHQTDFVFSIKINKQIVDSYRFRISAQREDPQGQGWMHWWVEYVEVGCPRTSNPGNPDAQKTAFVGQVCNSLPGLVNYGPSVETRSSFMSHMNSRADSGFWAVICTRGGGTMTYNDLDSYMVELATGYKNAVQLASTIVDATNFKFTCNLQLTREDTGVTVKKHFKLRAFYETDRWLVKEVDVGCDE